MYDELGIGELIDQLIPQDEEKRIVSYEKAVKAMVLNGLGFANRALYLTPLFFNDKPVSLLIGEGIEAEHCHCVGAYFGCNIPLWPGCLISAVGRINGKTIGLVVPLQERRFDQFSYRWAV